MNSKSKILIVFLLLFCGKNFYAQKISNLNVNSNFSKNEILNFINIKTNSPYFSGISNTIKSRLENNFNNLGYYNFIINVDVQRIDTSKYVINIDAFTGKPTIINIINFDKTDSLISEFEIKKINSLKGKIFSRKNVESIFSDILKYNEENAFPFAKIIIEKVNFQRDSTTGNTVNIDLNMLKGRRSKIDKIEIEGNSKTKSSYILNNARIKSGIDYDQGKIKKIPERLNRLKIFATVELPVYYINQNDEGILSLKVKEIKSNTFDGVIGYIPGNSNNGNGYFTGLVNLNMQNLFGTGRVFFIKWQQYERNSQDIEIRYLEPWIFNYPLNLNLGLFQRKYDSTYVQRKYESDIEFLASSEISASVFVQGEFVIPTVNQSQIFSVYNSDTYTSGVNFKYDSRDDFISPTAGFYFVTRYGYSRKNIKGPVDRFYNGLITNYNFQRYEFDFSYFYEIFTKNVFVLSFHARELKGDQFEIPDLYRFGGFNSIRGYRENQFLGNRILWNNLEYRLQFEQRSFLFTFFDYGYYLQKENLLNNIQQISNYKYGYGAGLTFQTGLGIMKVSYALGEGDNFNQGKIHFGLINGF